MFHNYFKDLISIELTSQERLQIQEKGLATVPIHATDAELEDLQRRMAQREVEAMMFDDSEDVVSFSGTNRVPDVLIDSDEEKAE